MHKIIFPLAVAIMLGGAAAVFAGNEMKTILTVKADGTCEIKTDMTQPRATAERGVKMWMRYRHAADGEDEPKPDVSKNEAADKPLSDAELASKLRESTEDRYDQMGEESAPKIDLLEVTNDTVHIVQITSFGSIEEFLASNNLGLEANRVWARGTRFEKDAKGQLVLTFTPEPQMKRYAKTLRQELKLLDNFMEFRVVLPGKIVSSTYSNVQDNATWYDFDPRNDAAITSAMTYYEEPVVIVSEMNGLKLDQPLDSKDLAQRGRRGGANGQSSELPITDAGPGFVAEAASVTTTTAHVFPEGEKYYKESGEVQAGTVVRAKLFAPKGRLMRSVSEVKVTKAVDDKGRNIAPMSGDSETSFQTSFTFNGNGEEEGPTQMPMDMRLGLPERDSQAIQEISGEAIAVTFGKWKEMTVTNLQGEIDLSSVLPGAKMILKNVKTRNRQTTMQVEIKGPGSIRELDIKNKEEGQSGQRMSNANLTDRGTKTKDGQATRKATLQIFSFNPDQSESAAAATNAPPLVVRFPEEERRERVKFKLTALDLF